jgi:hypothetical protein
LVVKSRWMKVILEATVKGNADGAQPGKPLYLAC